MLDLTFGFERDHFRGIQDETKRRNPRHPTLASSLGMSGVVHLIEKGISMI